jgi:hypothetical protein
MQLVYQCLRYMHVIGGTKSVLQPLEPFREFCDRPLGVKTGEQFSGVAQLLELVATFG